MVAASVGASLERGDTVVVQSMQAMGALGPSSASAPPREAVSAHGDAAYGETFGTSGTPAARRHPVLLPAAVGAVVFVLFVGLGLWWTFVGRRRTTGDARKGGASKKLSESERQSALAQVREWMRTGQVGRMPGDAS
jgi:flagellar M-ring protein FliF